MQLPPVVLNECQLIMLLGNLEFVNIRQFFLLYFLFNDLKKIILIVSVIHTPLKLLKSVKFLQHCMGSV